MDCLCSLVANSTQDPRDVTPRFGHVLKTAGSTSANECLHAKCPGDKYEILDELGEGSFGKADGSGYLLNLAFCEHACANSISQLTG